MTANWQSLQPGLAKTTWKGALEFYAINEDTVTAAPRLWTNGEEFAAILQAGGLWYAFQFHGSLPRIVSAPTFGSLLCEMPPDLRCLLGVPLPGDTESVRTLLGSHPQGRLSCNSPLGLILDSDPPEAHTFRRVECL